MSAIKKIEETYLNLFKIVLLLILTVALFAAIGLAIKGWIDSTAEPVRVAPAETAPNPSVDFESFIKSLEQPTEPARAPTPAAPRAPAVPQANPLDQMVDKYVEGTWLIYDSFQNDCHIEKLWTKQFFLDWVGLRNFYRSNFDRFGEPFASSQNQFIKTVYTDPRVVKLCIERDGNTEIFGSGLDWHLNQWVASVRAADEYNSRERSREQNEIMQARGEAALTRAFGQRMLWAALISFGVFMCLALLLIFSKIENNLRAIHEQELKRDPTTPKQQAGQGQ